MQSIPQLLQIVRATLREDIAADLQTDHARSQLAGVVDILSTLEQMVSWSPGWLGERLAAVTSGIAAFGSAARAAGHPLPASLSDPESDAIGADIVRSVERAEDRLAGIVDWHFLNGSRLPPAIRDELDKVLRLTMRQALLAERRVVAPADFGAMTAPTS